MKHEVKTKITSDCDPCPDVVLEVEEVYLETAKQRRFLDSVAATLIMRAAV